jgi:NAD(P)-dependent dehydrogenase (short-subunit alcohol dehydrogenase family)
MAGFPQAGCEEADMFDLTGHRALVTGAGDGMGVGIAHALARQGAAVAVNDIVASKAEATRDAILAGGGTAVSAPFDITDEAAVNAGVAAAGEALGGHLDILVNNAGIPADMAPVRFRDLPPARWRSYIDINLYGSLHCIAAVIEPMVEAHWGRIIQISSGAGRTGLKIGVSLYGASKSGIEGFIRHLSTEVASTGVTANALALGLMAAPNKNTDSSVTAGIARSIPVGRLGTPDDVGAAVVFLASNEMEWLTGQTVNLNGGSTFN